MSTPSGDRAPTSSLRTPTSVRDGRPSRPAGPTRPHRWRPRRRPPPAWGAARRVAPRWGQSAARSGAARARGGAAGARRGAGRGGGGSRGRDRRRRGQGGGHRRGDRRHGRRHAPAGPDAPAGGGGGPEPADAGVPQRELKAGPGPVPRREGLLGELAMRRSTMNRLQATGLILVLGGVALAAPTTPASAAGKYDGSKPMLCAVTRGSGGTKDGNCERSAPQEGNNLPGFMRVDVKGKLLSDNDGSGRKTEINSSAIVDNQLMLQGAENGKAWTIVIASDSGAFGSSVVEDDGLFAFCGVCNIP